MNRKVLSLVSMFVASFIVGYNMLSTTQEVQASPPVFISPIELASLMKMEKPVENIDVEYNVETQEVTVKGTTGNQNVKVTITGEVKPDTVIKWRTKIKEKLARNGYPHIAAMYKVTDKPILFNKD